MQRKRVVTQDLGAEWVVEMEWPEGDVQSGPRVLKIRPADPDAYPSGGLSSTVLREVKFRDAAAQLRRQEGASSRRQDVQAKSEAKRIDRLRDELAKGITGDYLALLSSVYLTKVLRGQAKPVEAIAAELGKGVQTIRGHLWRAKTDGYLNTAQGRKGGTLTAEGQKIVESMFPSGLESLTDTLNRLREEQQKNQG